MIKCPKCGTYNLQNKPWIVDSKGRWYKCYNSDCIVDCYTVTGNYTKGISGELLTEKALGGLR